MVKYYNIKFCKKINFKFLLNFKHIHQKFDAFVLFLKIKILFQVQMIEK